MTEVPVTSPARRGGPGSAPPRMPSVIRSFHHAEFSSVRRLLAAKEARNETISLCIPTLNEEASISKTIRVLKSTLQDRFPLLDEIAVFDSGSTDRTRELAEAEGVPVFRSADILPRLGRADGKGENLHKAVHQLRGDLICFVDADIRNIHPRFVTGVVAPLLLHSEIDYVKAFYRRNGGGGRVTEILIRPLFSLFYPELCALAQPLSGEYAARRSLLERLPFPTGYGVETAHLIDALPYGIERIAQTDTGLRMHRTQTARQLGKMSFEILHALFRRLRDRGVMSDASPLPELLRQFDCQADPPSPVHTALPPVERPPLITLPAYRKRHGRPAPGP